MDERAAGSSGSSAGRRRLMSAWRIVRAALIAYLLVALLAMLFEESLIFFPSPYPNGDWQPAGLGQEEIFFQAADGTRLHGWYVPHDHPRAVVLFCHGNAGNVTHRAGSLRALHNGVGVAVLVFDYRGYGRSGGRPSEEGIIADARAARAWLAQRTAVPEEEIVVLGESLGGAVAVHLAAEDGAGALVLESTFTSLADMGAELYPWLPVRYLIRTRLDSLSKNAKYPGAHKSRRLRHNRAVRARPTAIQGCQRAETLCFNVGLRPQRSADAGVLPVARRVSRPVPEVASRQQPRPPLREQGRQE